MAKPPAIQLPDPALRQPGICSRGVKTRGNAERTATTPDDADAVADGHQVDLIDGRGAVMVTVTAQDGTTKAYTVNVEQAQPMLISLDVKTPGELEEAGEKDWFSVTLTSGKFYMFERLGGEAGTTPYQIRHGTLRYPHIRLYDAVGQGVVAADVTESLERGLQMLWVVLQVRLLLSRPDGARRLW